MVAIPILFAIALICLVALIIYFSIQHEKQRTEELNVVADDLGLQSIENEADRIVADLGVNFKLFQRGRGRKAVNVKRAATDDLEITIFDYAFTTGSGKNRNRHNQTVLLMRSPHITTTKYLVRPEGALDAIGSALGFQDIDFDHHPKFSSMFVLQGDEPSIREEFHDGILDFFAEHKGMYSEGIGETLILCRKNRRIKAEDLKDQIELAYKCSALFRKDRV